MSDKKEHRFELPLTSSTCSADHFLILDKSIDSRRSKELVSGHRSPCPKKRSTDPNSSFSSIFQFLIWSSLLRCRRRCRCVFRPNKVSSHRSIRFSILHLARSIAHEFGQEPPRVALSERRQSIPESCHPHHLFSSSWNYMIIVHAWITSPGCCSCSCLLQGGRNCSLETLTVIDCISNKCLKDINVTLRRGKIIC